MEGLGGVVRRRSLVFFNVLNKVFSKTKMMAIEKDES